MDERDYGALYSYDGRYTGHFDLSGADSYIEDLDGDRECECECCDSCFDRPMASCNVSSSFILSRVTFLVSVEGK